MAQFDPKDCKVVAGGILITGFAEDSYVEIEFQTKRWSMKVGADGEGIFSKSNDRSAIVKIVLMPSAASNLALDGFLQADAIDNLGTFPISITDLSTGTVHSGLECKVLTPPKKSYKKEAEPIEWEIGVLEMISNYGAAGL